MSEDAKTRKGRRGIFGSIARLFGGGSDRSAEPKRPEVPATGTAAKSEAWAGGAAAAAAPDPVDASTPAASAPDDEEDPLVLGPAYKAAPAEPEEAGATPDPTTDDDSEDELILTGGTDESSEDELVLSGCAANDARDAKPSAAREEDLAEEEEDILARMRARLGGAAGAQDTDQNNETSRSDDQTGDTGGSEAALAPEAGGPSDPSWLSGEDRDDREGTFPASDARPDGREPMEGKEMDPKDETETDEDRTKREAEETGAALFPGAMRGAAEDVAGEEDSREEDAREQESGEENSGEDESRKDESGKHDSGELAVAGESADPGEDSGADSGEDPWKLPEMNGEGDAETGATATVADLEPLDLDDAGKTVPVEAEEQEPDRSQGMFAAMAAEIEGEAEDLGETPAGPAAEADAGGVVDEAALEETVRRLIREELEGELGERISRNIRKIIREEVAHAMLRNR